MGLMAPPQDLVETEVSQVITVEGVSEWCQTVCSGFNFQSEALIHMKAIVQHVAVTLLRLGSKALNASTSNPNEAFHPPGAVEPEHIQRGLHGTALGEFLVPFLTGQRADRLGVVCTDKSDEVFARWCPPSLVPHWLPHHAPILAGLAGSTAAHFLRGGPALTPHPSGKPPSAAFGLLTMSPFCRGLHRSETAAAALLDRCLHPMSAENHPTVTAGGPDGAVVVPENGGAASLGEEVSVYGVLTRLVRHWLCR
jgi:hypothetical protein